MAERKKPYRRPVNALAPYIGKVTIAWNDIQFAIHFIFVDLLRDRKLGRSLFFSVSSDRAQQRMVMEAIDAVLQPVDAALAAKLKKRIKGLQAFGARRNEVVHALWTQEFDTMALTPLQPRSSLKGKNLKTEMNKLTDELMLEASALLSMRFEMISLPTFSKDYSSLYINKHRMLAEGKE